jgi:hypothetical protein
MTDLSDKAFVLDQLEQYPDGRDAVQIISASFRIRGCGVGAVHSRVAELRDEGYQIPPAYIEGKTRRGFPRYVYRLIGEPQGRALVESRPSVEQEPLGVSRGTPAAPLDAHLARQPGESDRRRPDTDPQPGGDDARVAPIPGQLRLIA